MAVINPGSGGAASGNSSSAIDWSSFCTVQNGVPAIDCIPHLFQLLVYGLFTLVGSTAAIFIIIAGYKLIFARGDAKELDSAHKTFFYALIGLIIVLLSFLIVSVIGTITGATCISNFGFVCNQK